MRDPAGAHDNVEGPGSDNLVGEFVSPLRAKAPMGVHAVPRVKGSATRDRDAIAQQLLRRRTSRADAIADLIDLLSINADARRRVARLLGELEALG
jgi:hypothetical protein